MTKTAVVILNWNGKELLERFLPVVLEYSRRADTEVIVADNGSQDDSVSFVGERFSSVRIIDLGYNYGFAGGYNRALEQVEAQYYVLLNSDVEVTAGWLEPLEAFMDEHPAAGACMPKIRSFREKEKFEYAGAAGGYIDRFGYPFCRGRIFNTLEEDRGQYDTPARIFWASGACMMVRAEVYHRLKGLDTDFFAHMEEIDLCWRMQRAGYEVYSLPQSVVYHVGGASLNEASPVKTYLNFRNDLFLLHKNLPRKRLKKVLFVRLVLDGVAALKFLAGLQVRHHLAVWKAHFYFWGHLRMLREKRKQLASLSEGPVYGMYGKNIVYRYFIKGIRFFSELREEDFYG